ncbi:mitochondrial carrier protein, putative [Trypanosoma brucei brucei TREU927]|uniref:Mitochondrial carrier protein, putative n=1 Tax=Trypanosoma brucei brucei (strain 927/4 GUTat10.1) TaxID=185431 RepID=Q57ZL4_TRYB2|nr:mitochondrial carrier protein, putative [Trypanosoma brucei brucei TREU927]AAX79468.1 mitochondrial carrier protein, putative [Trypanosoma brucei]AAZ10332.1 mitochondrial carrier protein, putative [Trypanosoma brucei brucei TREU927]
MVSEGTSAAGRLEGESPLALRVDTGEIVAGCLAGFVEHFFMFPFDTLKTRVQSGDSTNVILAAKRISRNERLAHLYRGFAPIIVSAVPAHGAYYSTYEAAKRVFGEDSTVSITVSASCAVAAHDTISTPFDVIKQRMQMDGSRKFASSLQCGQCAVAEGGVRCLLLSLPTTILMNIPHFSAYWLVYEGFLAYLGGERRNRETEVAGDYITGGLLAGTVASIVSSPLDVVKTQLQLGLRKNIPDAVRYVLVNRGTKGFFAGVTARVMCTAPAGALSMITYETAKKFMEER